MARQTLMEEAETSTSRLADLERRLDEWWQEAEVVLQDVKTTCDSMNERIQNVLKRYPPR